MIGRLAFKVLDGGHLPVREPGSVGWDCFAREGAWIEAGEEAKIPLGIIVRPPRGTWALLVPRSSLFDRRLLMANSVGIVDPTYCGAEDELAVRLLNASEHAPVRVNPGDKLVQLVLIPTLTPAVTGFEPKALSRGGFGSTGRRRT